MEYYLAIKRNEVLLYATLQTNITLENIMLSKRSHSKKTTYYMRSFIWE